MERASLALSLALLLVLSAAVAGPQVRLFSSDPVATSAHYSVTNCFFLHKSNA
jgi:hypothetical protein